GQFGFGYNINDNFSATPNSVRDPNRPGITIARFGKSIAQNKTFESTLTYARNWNNFKFSGLLGGSFEQASTNIVYAQGMGYEYDELLYSINNATLSVGATQSFKEYKFA